MSAGEDERGRPAEAERAPGAREPANAADGSATEGPAAEDTATEGPAAEDTAAVAKKPSRWARLVALLDEREAPTSLALVRLVVAAVLLADWVAVLRRGLVPVVWGPSTAGAFGIADTFPDPPLYQALLGASPTSTWLVFGLAFAATLTFALGLFTRTSALVLALASAQLAQTLPQADRGIDGALRLVLLLLACSGAGARWSLDAWRRHRTLTPDIRVPAWPRYLIVLQVVWIYFSAGMHKTQGAWWPAGDGAALYIILRDPHFARFELPWLDAAYPLTQLGTYLTMLFELGAPFMLLALWYRRTAERPGRLRRAFNRLLVREVWLTLGVGFHLALALLVRLGIFPWGMLAFYPAFFRPEAAERFLARLRGR